MAKLADLRIMARNDDDKNITHSATYACYVSSDGTFSAVLPPEIEPAIKRLSDETRAQHKTTVSMNKKGDLLLNCGELLALKAVLYAYSKSMTEAAVTNEFRIFYTVKLDAPYYKSQDGVIHPNGEGVPNYNDDNGKWHGEHRFSGGWGSNVGSIVGVGARVCIERCVTPAGGEPSWSYPRIEREDRDQLGTWALLLNKWTGQPGPSDQRGKRTELKSIPYTEEAARMFHEVLLRLSTIADQLETHLSDHEALPAMIAAGSVPLLQGPNQQTEEGKV